MLCEAALVERVVGTSLVWFGPVEACDVFQEIHELVARREHRALLFLINIYNKR
jgi:hypothetical protein